MNRTLHRLDSTHDRLLATITLVQEEIFSQRPGKDEWSVAEIIHHLCLVEERVIKDLEKAIAGRPQKISFLRRLVPTSIVAARLLRVKAPKAVNPLNAPEKQVVIENFNAARQRLKQLCSDHGKARLKQVIFKHPFLGDLDGIKTVSFVGYHELRHFKQVREVLRRLQHPTSQL
jgi:uncharacterized damage-inducible protein DinB